jgi:TRAP-type C4-dicarboxylate transport system permease large subunit
VLQNMTGHDTFYVARAALPFFFLLLFAIVIITVFPGLVTWLPEAVMKK